MEKGKEMYIVKQLNGKIITEYRSGHKWYKYGYLTGKRHGEELSYKRRFVYQISMWIHGHSTREIWFYLALLLIIMTAIAFIYVSITIRFLVLLCY